jgi:L-alanine-DL-glutamate epimerase-like enolase superfamily enzyme
MKIGSDPARDPYRAAAARDAIGDAGLFVDANGAFSAKHALALAERISQYDVTWFEEPVSSDDVEGLALMRARAPAGMDIAAGEYGYNLDDFRRLLAGPSVDVLQADATRCGGVTGFLQVAALCEAQHIDLSGHCAPALHLPVTCAVPRLRHLK